MPTESDLEKCSPHRAPNRPPRARQVDSSFFLFTPDRWWGVALVAMTMLAYAPVVGGGFNWDDQAITQNPNVSGGLAGLLKIWTGTSPYSGEVHYWPVTYTIFWFEHIFWGNSPDGYQTVNILLHTTNAILLWRILIRLQAPGAWMAAAIFALHPVHVESVAWIVELKDVLSGFLYLLAFHTLLEFKNRQTKDSRDPVLYGLAVVCFLGAMWSKSITVSLPIAIVLFIWARVLNWRGKLFIIPFILVSIVVVAWDLHVAGIIMPNPREHEPWPQLWQKPFLAGRALWFYFQNLLWPANLMTIYPRWNLDSIAPMGIVFVCSAFLLIAALWALRRRIGRAPTGLTLFFVATLLPVLNLIDHGFMKYSFVADRFQYLACIGPIVMIATLMDRLFHSLPPVQRFIGPAFQCSLLVVMGLITWHLGWVYYDDGTLFTYNISKNPQAWQAEYGLGNFNVERGKPDEALAHYLKALSINPRDSSTVLNVGNLLYQKGEVRDAEAWFSRALELDPDQPRINNNLGAAKLSLGHRLEAMGYFSKAVRLQSDNPEYRYNLALAYFDDKRYDEAIEQLQTVISLSPGYKDSRNYLEQARLAKSSRDNPDKSQTNIPRAPGPPSKR